MSDDVTFRDFAGALMGNDDEAAHSVLQTLLGIDEAKAAEATTFFQDKMKASPDFMMKAMGMRAAVDARDVGELGTLVADCFGLDEGAATRAATHLLGRYD